MLENCPAIAAQIFARALEEMAKGYPADKVISATLKEHKSLGSKERKKVQEQVWHALRHLGYLRWKSETTGTAPTPDLLFALSLEPIDFTGAPDYVRYDCPKFLSGEIALEDLTAMQSPTKAFLRVNLSRTTLAKAQEMLAFEGIKTEPVPDCPTALSLPQRARLEHTAAFTRGFITPQDKGSQLLSLAIAEKIKALAIASQATTTQATPAKPVKVLDLCAGAGGKTLALYDYFAAQQEKAGQAQPPLPAFTAADISAPRLAELAKRAKTMGFKDIDLKVLPDDYEPFLSTHADAFDIVIVDAPCSGTGTWARSPDAKWRLTPEKLAAYESLQSEILARAGRFVAPSPATGTGTGTLFYITCSLRAKENEAQVASFLSTCQDFTLKKEWHFSPSLTHSDGFYLAELIKSKTSS